MRKLRNWAGAILAVVLLAGCGSDSDGGDDGADARADEPAASPSVEEAAEGDGEEAEETEDASPSPSEDAAPTSVARERFCPDLDLTALGTAMGGSGPAAVDGDFKPGDPAMGVGKATGWICWVSGGTGVLIAEVSKAKLSDQQFTQAAFEPAYEGTKGGCTAADAPDLGPGTVGYDCSFSGVVNVAMAIRYGHLDGALVKCQLQATDPKRLADLQAAAPEVCGLVLDAVAA